jgi:phage recombination protein Bet
VSTDLTIRDDQTYWTERQVAGLRQIGVGNAAPADLAVFFHYAVKTGLDPFARQIYMIERQGKQTIQTGIDGLRLIARRAADRSGGSFGIGDIFWCGEDGIWRDVWLAKIPPSAAKSVVYRDGQPFSAVALFSEYAGTKRDGSLMSMWATKGALMLGKCAEASALRKAFPQDLSGLYSFDEMAVADEPHTNGNGAQPRRPGMAGLRDAVAPPAPKADEPVDAEVVDDTPRTGGGGGSLADTSVTEGAAGSIPASDTPPSSDRSAPGATSPAPGSDTLTRAQLTKIHVLLGEQGMGEDRDLGLGCLSDILDREVGSSKTLTKAEAHKVIERLELPDPSESPMEATS